MNTSPSLALDAEDDDDPADEEEEEEWQPPWETVPGWKAENAWQLRYYLEDKEWSECPKCDGELTIEAYRSNLLVLECERGCSITGILGGRPLPNGKVSVRPRPVITISGQSYKMARRALEALATFNLREVPRDLYPDPWGMSGDKLITTRFVFQRDGELVTVRDGAISPLRSSQLRSRLAEVARWRKEEPEDKENLVGGRPPVLRLTDPPEAVVRAILDLGEYPDIPTLERVATAPFVAPDGSIVSTAGYHVGTRTYYEPAPELVGLDVPATVTREDVEAAKALLLDELLGDFPFVAEADRAHALSYLLEGFVRDRINGPVPVYWIGAPVAGTGKGKLADCCTIPAHGVVASQSFSGSEEERRKLLTTNFRDGAPVVKLDNVKGAVNSPALEGALTERVWTDRILGGNTSVRVPIRASFSITANNARPSTDLNRRQVPIRLDAKVERPFRRSGPAPGRTWRHLLPEWAIAHRADLVRAALTLVRWWVQRGMPAGAAERAMGSFEAWSAVMGGILQASGVEGFLDNLAEVDEVGDEDRDELAEFLAAWRATYGDREMAARELVEDPAFASHVGRHVGRHVGPWTVGGLGAWLREHKDRIAGGLRLVYRKPRHAVGVWSVVETG